MFLAQCFRFHSGEHTLVILEIRDAIFFTWQTIPLRSKPLLCSPYFSAQCHSCCGQFSELLLTCYHFLIHAFSIFILFLLKSCVQRHNAMLRLNCFSPIPLYRLNTSWSWYSNTLGFSTLSFHKVRAFRQNIILRGTLHPFMQKPHSLSCSFFNN